MELGIGMIHQHFKLVEVFSAMDNIVLGVQKGSATASRPSCGRRSGNSAPPSAWKSTRTKRYTTCR